MSARTPTPWPPRAPALGPRPDEPPALSTPRRLQRMGAVTVGVSLPREWVGQRGLTPGHSVFLRTLPDGSLILRDSERTHEPTSVVLEVPANEPGEHLFRRLIGAYLAGATEFVIRQPGGLTGETRGIARSFARRTGHTESVSEEGAKLILRDVSTGAVVPVPRLLRRMFQMVFDLQVEAGTAWLAGSTVSPAGLSARDDEVDRYAWQIERGLRRSPWEAASPSDPEVGDPFRSLLWARDLERIGDHAVLLGEHGTRLAEAGPPDSLRRMLSTYHAQALEHLKAAHAVALSPDAVRANELLDVGDALHETEGAIADRILLRETTDRLAPAAIRSLGLVLQSIDRTTGYAQNLAEIGLDRDLERVTRSGPRHPSTLASSFEPTGIPATPPPTP
ncbi:MAG TPA: PhoU domain-containing protein [Thermoplasmata archaeon]|nr:PhoU domain-containing protein [Thermoplasmata archaeon]